MGKWTYTILDIIFFVPLIVFCVFRYRSILKKRLEFIFFSGLVGGVLYFIIDIPATYWGAWTMNLAKTFPPIVGLSVFEELVWAILVCMTVAVVIEVVLSKKK